MVRSSQREYAVRFESEAFASLAAPSHQPRHLIVDARVADLYSGALAGAVASAASVLRVEATESAKSLERCPDYIQALVAAGIHRGHLLVAIGGGIIQDITCFLAAMLLRGLDWEFCPTTLLAQADSCIGSKSSINVGHLKNIVGTFTPPRKVTIDTSVLRTLTPVDLRSGVGEMLKVHAIAGPAAFADIARDYDSLLADDALLRQYIVRSLEFKKRLIEIDEFDRGPRLVMNYGHSFGHAIEAATSFAIPHGIAVTIGMDMANWVAAADKTDGGAYERMHRTLMANAKGFECVPVPFEAFLDALLKDKKNTGKDLRLVLPQPDSRIALTPRRADEAFRARCAAFLENRSR